jgi:hypothetical protein
MVAILVLDPLLLLAYIAWISIPSVRVVVSPSLAASIVWGSVSALSIIPMFKNVGDAERSRKRAVARQAPVRDLIEFVAYEGISFTR